MKSTLTRLLCSSGCTCLFHTDYIIWHFVFEPKNLIGSFESEHFTFYRYILHVYKASIHKDVLFSFKSKRKYTENVSLCCGWHRREYAVCIQWIFSKKTEETNCWKQSVISLSVNGTVTSLPVFIQNKCNCVQKTNKAFTGLEWHWG